MSTQLFLLFAVQKTMAQGKEYCERKINLLKSNFDELAEVRSCRLLCSCIHCYFFPSGGANALFCIHYMGYSLLTTALITWTSYTYLNANSSSFFAIKWFWHEIQSKSCILINFLTTLLTFYILIFFIWLFLTYR